jgi:hypothetical protein
MAFVVYANILGVMDSGIRKDRALVTERRQSMTFFYGRNET